MSAIDLQRDHLDDAVASIPPRTRLRPAALARYVDLEGLRHDFPLVLTEHDGHAVATLTETVNEILRQVAPEGARGERLRQHVLRLETAIRRRVESDPGQPTLAEVWDRAQGDLLPGPDSDGLRASLATARAALRTDGRVVRCDDAPAAVLRHLRAGVEQPRAAALRAELTELVRRLTAVLAVDEGRSPAGRDPVRLRAGVGTPHEQDFDFAAWSEILASTSGDVLLSEARHTRIEWALGVLREQRFVAVDDDLEPRRTFTFEFDSCARALAAHHDRLPDLVRLVKAIAIAELELDNAYDETIHGAYFHAFDAAALHADDVLPFPRYLVLLDGGELDESALAEVLEVLASPMPCKIVVVTADALGPPPLHDPLQPRPLTGVDLAAAALGLGSARVVQTTTAGLARMSGAMWDALAADGPALISIVTGASHAGPDLPPYLAAAAAAEARAVPGFAYEPPGDADGRSSFTLSPNAQPAADWPVHEVVFEDEFLQRVREDLAFTVADLVATDPRFADHVALTPRHAWTDAMVPVAEFLRMEAPGRRGHVPYVLMVDEDDVLRRVVVDDRVVSATERVRAAWRRLQERAGVRDAEERRRLAEDRAAIEAERDAAARAATMAALPAPDATTAAEAKGSSPGHVTAGDAVEEQSSGELATGTAATDAWIETARCTTCDECTSLNPRMFAYNDDKQAYIADLHAGTFSDLVQAAEACQVAIIHPGEPWDPNEDGLDDLRVRAAAFT